MTFHVNPLLDGSTKHQALFSSKDKNKVSSAAILLGSLRVNFNVFHHPCFSCLSELFSYLISEMFQHIIFYR